MTLHDLIHTCRNIYAIGRNYRAHAAELNNPVPSEPLIFSKTLSSICCGETIALPFHLGPIHFEAEIVLRIGKAIPMGAFSDLSCVSHLGLGIDFTARDLQARLKEKGHPWHRAKSFSNAAYLGAFVPFETPWEDQRFQLRVNEKLVQAGDTRLMIFSMFQLLEAINVGLPLMEGDLIFSGTPKGVGEIHAGDSVRMTSEAMNLDLTAKVVAQP